jgi:hypothetical protein
MKIVILAALFACAMGNQLILKTFFSKSKTSTVIQQLFALYIESKYTGNELFLSLVNPFSYAQAHGFAPPSGFGHHEGQIPAHPREQNCRRSCCGA